VASYQDLINRYRELIQGLQASMLKLVTIVPAFVTFFLFWLAMLQVLVLAKGWEWLRGQKQQPELVTVNSAPPPAAIPAATAQVAASPAIERTVAETAGKAGSDRAKATAAVSDAAATASGAAGNSLETVVAEIDEAA
jgi:hypothetical protein